MRTDKKDFKEFKTANGRSVFDGGGGVFPDIEVTSAKTSSVTKALLKDNAIFEYATQYYYDHQFSDLSEFSFSDADYAGFTTFLQQTGFNYETETEDAFAKALQEAEKEGLNSSINSAYTALQNSIKQAKNKEIQAHSAEIKEQLIDEIVKRYFYRDGLLSLIHI